MSMSLPYWARALGLQAENFWIVRAQNFRLILESSSYSNLKVANNTARLLFFLLETCSTTMMGLGFHCFVCLITSSQVMIFHIQNFNFWVHSQVLWLKYKPTNPWGKKIMLLRTILNIQWLYFRALLFSIIPVVLFTTYLTVFFYILFKIFVVFSQPLP